MVGKLKRTIKFTHLPLHAIYSHHHISSILPAKGISRTRSSRNRGKVTKKIGSMQEKSSKK